MPLTFGREKLKGTSKTQGDFNLQNRFSIDAEPERGHHIILPGVSNIEGLAGEGTQTTPLENGRAIRSLGSAKSLRPNPPITLQMAFAPENVHFYNCLGKNKVLYAFSVIFHDDAGTEVGRIVLSDALITKYERKHVPDAAHFGTNWSLEIQFVYQKATVLNT